MGIFYSKPGTYENQPTVNRFPIISPRHVPANISFKNTPYSKFDPKLYQEKFTFQLKALPKYT